MKPTSQLKTEMTSSTKKDAASALTQTLTKTSEDNCDVLELIADNLDIKSRALLASTSRLFRNSLKDRNKADQLLWYVISGNTAMVKDMLDKCPSLLLQRLGDSDDYAGCTTKGRTAHQVALSAGDVSIHEGQDEMCEMMMTYFDKIPGIDGRDEWRKQYVEWVIGFALKPHNLNPETSSDVELVECLDAHFAKQKSDVAVFDFTAIQTSSVTGDNTRLNIIEKIRTANIEYVQRALNIDTTSPLWQDLEIFRDAFDRKIKSDVIFNPYHLLKALELYDATFHTASGWGSGVDARCRRDLLWRQVVGYVQRFLPASIGKAIAQGLHGIVEKGKRLNRSSKLGDDGNAMYPVCHRKDTIGLGYNYAAANPYNATVFGGRVMICVDFHVFSHYLLLRRRRLCQIMNWQPKPLTERPSVVKSR